ncbi:muscular LMNA-interacting protein isoform X29 [Marmota marmota marmota]|uniref:muscular LMNA-interacting protein isoform X29 n=1 Tax=Marmota marmota marmota TaxID=9994 RepID=UPI002092E453|nr:muscular LMNA-interacting protein isoform X29 [Marmota marmota marmota]
MLPEQGLLSDCGNNYFQMNSCILAGSIQTTPQVSSGDSEAKPLIFTFVPTVRRLPTHIQLTDTSKFLVKIPEEPSDKSPETVNRSNSNDYLTFNRGSQEERNQGTLTYPSETSGKSIQGRVLETNQPQGMQQSDLFKAEYVFIVDSEGEDEVTSRKGEQGPPGGTGNMAARPKSLAISSSLVSDVVRPKIRGTDLKSSSYSEISHGMASQQKHGQQYKTKSSYKAFAAIPTNTLLLEQKTSTTLPKAAGRETKYANLSSPSSTVSESQLTKPGVIRPVPVKSKILLKKEEEVYEPNPFSKYLEDNSDLFSEQDVTVPHKPVSLHPLYQTKLYPPAKSLLQPQTLPHADCLTPGPFSHLSSFSLSDEQENSHTLLSHNAYNKLSHPMVAIPEHETLDSKEQ